MGADGRAENSSKHHVTRGLLGASMSGTLLAVTFDMERQARGFTLFEVLVAMTLLCSALTAVSQLLVVSTRATSVAQRTTMQTVFASQKLEELLTIDSSTLAISSPEAWMHTSGTDVEYLARDGAVLGTAEVPPAEAVYVRRWSVTAMPGTVGVHIISVSVDGVSRASGGGVADASPWRASRTIGVSPFEGGL